MPDLKISQLTNGNPAQTNDQIPINRAGVNFSITAGSIASLATANSANTEVLFNNNGVVDGDPQFTFNPTGDVLSLTGQLNVDNLRADGNTVSATNTNGDLTVAANGTGSVNLNTGGGVVFQAADNGAVTSFFKVFGGTGTNIIESTGSGTNISSIYRNKGTGSHTFATNINATQFIVSHTASAVNYMQLTGAATTGTPTFTAAGSDTNIGVRIVSKGTGQVQEGYASGFWALASQYDIGSDPNDVPLNQYLGTLAFQDATAVSVGQLLANGVAGIGYTLGAGSAVTQATSRTTGVTINAACGAITLVSAAGTTTWQSFTVTNSSVAANDTVIVNQRSGTDLNLIHVTAVAAGSFRISFATTGGTTTEQPVFNFAIIKASNV